MAENRVLVIGLDGATWDLIHPWLEAGQLPHLAGCLERGSGGELSSVLPPVSPAAWSSFMTGKNPGKHGIYDFTVRDFKSYDVKVALRPQEPTLWGMLSALGKQVCVVNVPQTYPPEPVNGIMVTGLGTPSQKEFTYPPGLTHSLQQGGYPLALDVDLRRDGAEAFFDGVCRASEQVTETAIRLLGERDWDFGMVVLRLTDEIPHYFWHWMDESHPAHGPADVFHREAVLRCYQKADELVGKLIATAADERTTVIVMSDHGFGPLHKDVYLNEWLRQQGFLVLGRRSGARSRVRGLMQRVGLSRTQVGHLLARWGLHRLRGALRDGLGRWAEAFPQDSRPHVADLVDWQRTRAYSIGYIGQIYVNLAGRDPEGTVAPGQEYEQLVQALIESLERMVDPQDGEPVVSQVFRREEAYSGPYLDQAPDLVVLMRDLAYITRQSYEFTPQQHVFAEPPTGETGGHRLEGVLLACGAHVAPGARPESAQIVDLAPTILHLLGGAVPEDLDGRVLAELVHPEFMAAHPVRVEEAPALGQQTPFAGMTPGEEREMLERLRKLGYIR